ncbi:MAG TPA: hypothetical protein VEH31_33170, partial [Streptosporangiaceae bacterium]|nr:hypothetical protein [Streptosporangiaceae bacterium]
ARGCGATAPCSSGCSPSSSRRAAQHRPRADWVQQQRRIAAQAWVLPPAQRDAALRERGDQMLRDRYRPLIAAP